MADVKSVLNRFMGKKKPESDKCSDDMHESGYDKVFYDYDKKEIVHRKSKKVPKTELDRLNKLHR